MLTVAGVSKNNRQILPKSSHAVPLFYARWRTDARARSCRLVIAIMKRPIWAFNRLPWEIKTRLTTSRYCRHLRARGTDSPWMASQYQAWSMITVCRDGSADAPGAPASVAAEPSA